MQPNSHILLVEDNPGDVRLTQKAFRDNGFLNKISVVSDGEEATQFLQQEGRFSKAQRPDLILLDLDLPKKTGSELLAELKQDPALKLIPVIILTSAASEHHIVQAYTQHANCYLTKPLGVDEFARKIEVFAQSWLRIVRLPNSPGLI